MYYSKQHRPFLNSILRLDAHQQQHPLEVLQYFISAYELREIRLLLHQLVAIALTTKNEAFARPKDRAKAACLARDLEELIEAVHLLAERKPH